jgi:hypothetical protein
MGPERFPIRDVKDGGQINGRIVNPVGYPDMGGFTGPGKWAEGKNDMRVEKPTSVRAAKRTTNGGSGDD